MATTTDGPHAALHTRHRAVLPDWLATYYARPIELTRGEGRYVWDAEGHRYLDFFGGILTTMTAHALPEVTRAVAGQAGRILHSSTLYLSHQAVELAERIAQLSGIPDARVFFTASGTEANDTALLLATGYRRSNQILALRNSYHGRSFTTIGVTGNSAWSPTSLSPLQTLFVHGGVRTRGPYAHLDDAGFTAACVEDLEDMLGQAGGPVAALIAEPVQGVGGFTSGPDGLLAAFKQVLDRHGILWITDEVQTGWGRTGDNFWGWQAHGQAGPPDILTFAKGIGNGLSMGGVVARAEVMNCLTANSISTFGGSPVTTAGALANLGYLIDHDLQGNARRVGGLVKSRLTAIAAGLSIVREVRGRGLMLGVELVEPGTDIPSAAAAGLVLEAAREHGLLLGKGGRAGNALRIAPPLSLTVAEAEEGTAALEAALKQAQSAMEAEPATPVRAPVRAYRGERPVSPSRTVVRGGLVITAADETHADLLIEGGRIAAIAAHESSAAASWNDAEVIDATGKYVIPGGVDAHTHMEMPFGGTTAADTFETGTRAAAWGGTTTIVDFAIQSVGGSLRAGLDAWHDKADAQCAIDYAFHMIVSDVNDETLKEMDILVEEGVTSFKMFMAYPGVFYSDDGKILRAMQRASGNGGLVMMHAENGIAIDVLVQQALAAGKTDPRFHGEVRHALLEAEATHRAIQLSRVAGSPLYVVHVSAQQAVAELAAARDQGLPVFGETCPQYLFLSTDNLAEPGFEGAKYVCSTPLRPREHQAALWQGLRTDDLQVVSTDHCPFCFTGQKDIGRDDFSKIPNGLPGVENRMDLLHQAVLDGHISRRRWIDIACAAPARMFGLYPRKGTLAPGADADVVIYDPHAEQLLSARTHHMNVDYSAYEGRRITGRVETVLSRGVPVIQRGSYVGRAGHGRYTPRGLCQYLG